MNERTKAISVVFLIVILLSGACFLQGVRLYNSALERITDAAGSVATKINLDVKSLCLEPYQTRIANFIETNPIIIQAFAQRDRQKTYHLALAKFKALQREDRYFFGMHFHLPDGTTFLRMHWPDFYGDAICNLRPTVQAVHAQKKPLAGFEVGRSGLYYRVMHPIFTDGKYIGALEFSINASKVQESFQRFVDSKGVLFLRHDDWQKIIRMRQITPWKSNNYILDGKQYGDYFRYLPEDLNFSGDERILEIDQETFMVHAHPIMNDFKGVAIGGILDFHDISSIMEQKTLFITRFFFFSCAMLFGALLALHFSFSKLIVKLDKSDRSLHALIGKLRKEIDERRAKEKSLQKYMHIVNASNDQMAFVDENYVYRKANKAYLAAHDKTKDEVIGQHVVDVFGPEIFRQTLKKHIDKALAGETVHYQYWHDYPRLGKCYMDVVYSPYTEQNGTISGIVVNSRDITRRKYAEEELQKYKKIVSASSDYMAFIDREYIYRTINDAHMRFLDKPREEIVGRSMEEILGRNTFECKVKRRIDRALTGQVVHFEEWCEFPGTGAFLLEITYYPFFDENKVVEGVISHVRDVTAQRKTEEHLRQRHKREALGTLAGGIAHDFNNILGAVIGCTELSLLEIPEHTSTYRHLTRIHNAATRAKKLVRQILGFCRQQECEQRPLPLAPLVKEIMQLMRATLPATIAIKVEITAENDVIMADQTMVHQMLMNLCTNAAQAMEKSGGELHVTLSSSHLQAGASDGQVPFVQLTIRDTGHGIEKSIFDRIFDPYFTTKRVGEGTGLGLAIVQNVVKQLRGTIEVESEPGKGTRARVSIPAHPVQEESVQEDHSMARLARGNARILLVDDEADLAQTCGEMLQHFGYKVTVETNSRKALDVFRGSPNAFDLLITDQTMPDLTGIELVQQTKRIRGDLPVILCSGYAREHEEEAITSLGDIRFIVKPVKLVELLDTVRHELDHSRHSPFFQRGIATPVVTAHTPRDSAPRPAFFTTNLPVDPLSGAIPKSDELTKWRTY